MRHPRTLSKGHVDVVTGEWVADASVHVCVCGKRECVNMRSYVGGSRGNERDETMTICPLSCP